MDEHEDQSCQCPNNEKQPEHSILYSLLASPTSAVTMETNSIIPTAENPTSRNGLQYSHFSSHHHNHHHHHHHHRRHHHHHHHCHLHRYQAAAEVSVKPPDIVGQQEAAQLLLKSMDFIKNLPAFWDLNTEDRLPLFLNSWSELLILKMAQNKFKFETEEQTLEQSQETVAAKVHKPQQSIPLLSDIKKIQSFIRRCQLLQLDDKEYAYIQAIIYLNPETPSLLNPAAVEEFQSDAQLCLSEYVMAMHPNDPLRFARILLGLPSLRNIKRQALIELFFRPLIGDVCMEEVLATMLQQ